MANISEYLQKIKSSKYGKDVRNSIHDSLKEMNEQIDLSEKSAGNSALAASKSAENAAQSEVNALQYSKRSLASANAAKGSESKSLEYSNAAATSADNAEKSNVASKQNADDSASSAAQSARSEENTRVYAESAKVDAEQINSRIDLAVESAESAEWSAENAATKSAVADEKADLAEQYALMAESFTHGGIGIRENETIDNAQYYYQQTKQISQGLNGIINMGTVTFENLPTTDIVLNSMYNISNGFISDERFNDGGGVCYGPGNNVVWTAEGKWDVTASSNVTGIKGAKETVYRQGNVSISPEDIGAVATGGDVAENTVSYTEATTLAELTTGEKLKVSFGKLKLAVKGVISILKLLGETDISKIGDGTVTGILDSLNSNLTNHSDQLSKLNTDISSIKSHVGMIIHSTTLNTMQKVIDIYGGTTWVKIEGRMLLGQSSSYAINSTGGSATNTLSVANLPSHAHSVGAHSHGLNNHNHSIPALSGSTGEAGSHSHHIPTAYTNASPWDGVMRATNAGGQNAGTGSSGNHSHTVTTKASTTGGNSGSTANSSAFNSGSTGSGTAINNMPPYKTVYIWERTA